MRNLFQTDVAYKVSRQQRRVFQPVVLVLLMAVLVACGPSAEPVSEEAVAGQDLEPAAETLPAEEQAQPLEERQAYPADDGYPPPPPAIPLVQESYPAETLPPPSATPVPDVYPPPTVAEVYAEPRIRLDLPVRSSDGTVTGTAPPGLAFAVVDVTYNGTLLGTGNTGADGRFSIKVDGLVEGNRLGLTFGDLEPGLTVTDMSIKYFPHRGEGFMNLPNVGVMLDSTLIEP